MTLLCHFEMCRLFVLFLCRCLSLCLSLFLFSFFVVVGERNNHIFLTNNKTSMTRWLLLLLLLVAICGGERVCDHPKQLLQIANLNIGNGCEGEPERLNRIREWALSQKINILGMNELNTWTEETLKEWAHSLNHSYFFFLETNLIDGRTHYNLGVTSNIPIVPVEQEVTGFWHGLLHVKIPFDGRIEQEVEEEEVEKTKEREDEKYFHLFITHLHPKSALERYEEIQKIKNYVDRHKYVLLMGDLNSLSPLDIPNYNTHHVLQTLQKDERLSRKFLSAHHDSIFYQSIAVLYESLLDLDYFTYLQKNLHPSFAQLHYALYKGAGERWRERREIWKEREGEREEEGKEIDYFQVVEEQFGGLFDFSSLFNETNTASVATQQKGERDHLVKVLKDSFTPSVPTPSNNDPLHALPMRLDYLFVSHIIGEKHEVFEGYIQRDSITDTLSDHYPVVASLCLPSP